MIIVHREQVNSRITEQYSHEGTLFLYKIWVMFSLEPKSKGLEWLNGSNLYFLEEIFVTTGMQCYSFPDKEKKYMS